MKTHTIHIALGEQGESQVLLGAGLTASAARYEASRGLTPLAQVVTARLEAPQPPLAIFAILASEEAAGPYFLDRIALEEPALAKHELARPMQVRPRG